ncbi:cyclase family protein [Nocardia pseudobrasiliensis]|uniref:Kynurenine formamidase n=1 Tax=Nocardia pseudobrasiliensis TaxID=45979 RepID=A0A370I007_9NOCA|nr:cyclase family protein [Nocardia pseudobrasiliensis]RDI63521.1 kynurenine formamidase [Nocardia pseudobrasiliensis]
MCAPRIVRLAHDHALARRGLLGAATAATAAAWAGTAPATPASARPSFGAVVDLTHTLTPQLPMWPGFASFAAIPVSSHDTGGFAHYALALWEHSGTHIDAPLHRVRAGASVDRIPAADLVAPLIVLDIAARAHTDPDTTLTLADIDAFEARHGRIPPRAFVALHSGWEQRLSAPGAFVNLDPAGVPHAPGFDPAAAAFLLTHRDIVGVGVDTLSLDPAASREFGAHTTILGAGRYGVEMLANLAAVPPTGATVVIGAPKHAGGTGGPARVLALT